MTNAPSGPTIDRFLEEALVYVYIAQYVRPDGPGRAGVSSGDCERYSSQLNVLLTRGDVRQPERSKNNAHLEGFITTPQGTEVASRVVRQALKANTETLNAEFAKLPQRLLRYLFEEMNGSETAGPVMVVTQSREVGRWDSISPQSLSPTYHCMLAEREVADSGDRLLQLFETVGLVVIATNYAIVQRDPIREHRRVLAGEMTAFWRNYLDNQGLAGRLWPLELEEMHTVFHQLDTDFGKVRQGREELQRFIPVLHREAVDSFLDECLSHKAINEETLPSGAPCFNVVDKVWYETARARRFKKPLLDFLLERRGDPHPQPTPRLSPAGRMELRLRRVIVTTLGGDPSRLPPHVLRDIQGRIEVAAKSNAALDVARYRTLEGKLEYSVLPELQAIVTNKALWANFQPVFNSTSKEALDLKFRQLAELRNGIAHNRPSNEVTVMEGEAAIRWFEIVLKDFCA